MQANKILENDPKIVSDLSKDWFSPRINPFIIAFHLKIKERYCILPTKCWKNNVSYTHYAATICEVAVKRSLKPPLYAP